MLIGSLSLNVMAASKLVIGIPETGYPPYIIVDDKGPRGLLIEPIARAAANLEIEIEYRYTPEKRSRILLDRGEIDARMESKKWVGAPNNYYWTDSFIDHDDVFVFHKKTDFQYRSDQDLVGVIVITHLGYSYPTLEALFRKGKAKRQDSSSEHAMLATLLRFDPNYVQVAVMNHQVATWLIQNNGLFRGQFDFSDNVVDTAPLQMQFYKSARLKNMVERLNVELSRMDMSQYAFPKN